MIDSKKATSQILKNSWHLLLMQVANYALPLITFPYLVLTLGPVLNGQVQFANAMISFLITFADFGLNITATEQISLNRNDQPVLQTIINKALILRSALVGLIGLFWLIIILLAPKLSQDPTLYLLTFLMVPAQVLNPAFYFQGRDEMGPYARLMILSKLIFTISVFFLVKHSSDYHWVNPLNAAGTFIANVIGWLMLFQKQAKVWSLRLLKPDWHFIKQSWYVMVGQIGQNSIGTAYAVVAGFYLSPLAYGQFTIADKLIWPFRQLIGAGFQATFPQVTKLVVQAPVQAKQFLNKLQIAFTAIGLAGIAGTLVCAPYIVQFLNKGTPDPQATLYLRLLSPIILLIALQVPLQQKLFATNRKHVFTRIILIATAITIIGNVMAIQIFGVYGVIITLLLVELFVLFNYWNRGKNLL